MKDPEADSDSVITLDDVCEFIVDCLHKTAPTQSTGYPSIRTPNVGRGRLILQGVNRVSAEVYEEWTKRAVPEPGDLILAREAPAGNVAAIKDGQTVCLGQRTVHLRPDRERVDSDFLCYYLLAPRQQGFLLAGETGATAGHVNMRDIRRLDIGPLPSLDTQKTLGQTLSAYDDLIENNRRRIALLEEAARLLYREWFVHFRFPGYEHARNIDGIPEGWESVPVKSVCSTYDDGDWLETKDQGGSDYRILQISNIGSNSFVETGNWRYITEETFRRLNCHEVVPGDILVSRMPRPIGRGWMVTPMPFRMVTAVDVTIVRADQSRVEPYLLLHHINSDQNVGRCEANATGATRPRISRKNMGNLPITLPPMELQHQFAEIAPENNRLRDNLFKQNESLAKARDLLLPRLMKGEITV